MSENMRISSKGRYGLAAIISMAESYYNGEYITIISIAENLDISKIYLEQIFAQLKKANVISSIKGAQGGYRLSKSPDAITAYDVLVAIEQSIFEKTETTVAKSAEHIELTIQNSVFNEMDNKIEELLKNISLSDLVNDTQRFKNSSNLMFFI